MSDQTWIDLAILTPTINTHDINEERWKRVKKVVPFDKMNGHDWKLLSDYARSISAWAQTSQWIAEYIDAEVIEELKAIHPIVDDSSDILELATLMIQQFLLKSETRVTAQEVKDYGPKITFSNKGLHEHTTFDFVSFNLKPYRILKCAQCGVPFYVTRASKFCSNKCRVANHRKGKES